MGRFGTPVDIYRASRINGLQNMIFAPIISKFVFGFSGLWVIYSDSKLNIQNFLKN